METLDLLPNSGMAVCGDSLYVYSAEWSNALQKNTITYAIYNMKTRTVDSRTMISDGTKENIKAPYGIAVNPRRPEIKERLIAAGLNIVDINSLKDRAKSIIGEAAPLPFGDKVVGIVMNRDGSVMDVIKNIVD